MSVDLFAEDVDVRGLRGFAGFTKRSNGEVLVVDALMDLGVPPREATLDDWYNLGTQLMRNLARLNPRGHYLAHEYSMKDGRPVH